MEELLAKAKNKAEMAEVFVVSSEITPVEFETNRLKSIQRKQTTTVALRVIKQGRLGYAVSTRLDDREGLVRMALETAEFGMPARFTFPPYTTYPAIDIFDPEIKSLSSKQMIEIGEALLAPIIRHTPDIVCEAEVARGHTIIQFINSEGAQSKYQTSSFEAGVSGTLVRDTDMLFVGDGESLCHPITETIKLTERVIKQLELAKKLASLPSKKLPVVFTPNGIASTVLAPLMAAFNGKLVVQGISSLAGKLGQKAFAKEVTLWDDPTIAYHPQSRPFDDEGMPSQKTPLIQEGRVASFLYDLQTAALANAKSTASAGRSGGGLPAPAPSAFVLDSGSTTFDDMVSDIKEGLVVEQVMGAEQGNILSGDFSGNVLLGYKIESGKIVGRVKNTMISSNIYEVFNQLVAIGNDTRWVGGHLKTPSLYCANLSVATKT